jgi:hypothetical protein
LIADAKPQTGDREWKQRPQTYIADISILTAEHVDRRAN